jgi:hypothetical protein
LSSLEATEGLHISTSAHCSTCLQERLAGGACRKDLQGTLAGNACRKGCGRVAVQTQTADCAICPETTFLSCLSSHPTPYTAAQHSRKPRAQGTQLTFLSGSILSHDASR